MSTATIVIEHDPNTDEVKMTVSGASNALELAEEMLSVNAIYQAYQLLDKRQANTH